MDFKESKKQFDEEVEREEGHKVMLRVSEIISDVGGNFTTLNGGELADAQSKLAGYKFFLADFMLELNRKYESLNLEMKYIRATEWDRITEEIKAKKGKVKNKEQIENVLIKLTVEMRHRQMLYETLYYKYRLQISSIDSVLTAIAQRIKELNIQMNQNL